MYKGQIIRISIQLCMHYVHHAAGGLLGKDGSIVRETLVPRDSVLLEIESGAVSDDSLLLSMC